MASPVPTYYDVLQVDRDATPEGIRLAWRKLAQKYHPDRRPDNANAVRAMAAINAAYDVLSDPHQRALHDVWIEQAETGKPRLPRTAPRTRASRWAIFHPVTAWPWYLLFATMTIAFGTIGTALYMASPLRSPPALRQKVKAPAPSPQPVVVTLVSSSR